MNKILLIFMMVTVSAFVSNCSKCNTCSGTPAASDCSGANSYTGNWY